jgi:diacylglycerol kinase
MNRAAKENNNQKFSIAERLESFTDAFRGTVTLFRYEHNARIHLVILVVVVIAGFLLDISGRDWLAILFVTGLVFASECFNTAVEYLSDQIMDEQNENIRKAKDVAAAGVLISAIISVLTGAIIFLPEILRVMGK